MMKIPNCIKSIIAPFYSSVHTLPKIALAPSYYPECPRKCLFRRYFELVVSRFTTHSTNLFYNAYGMDLKKFRGGGVYHRTRVLDQNYQSKLFGYG